MLKHKAQIISLLFAEEWIIIRYGRNKQNGLPITRQRNTMYEEYYLLLRPSLPLEKLTSLASGSLVVFTMLPMVGQGTQAYSVL
jgi:hypothetical protein